MPATSVLMAKQLAETGWNRHKLEVNNAVIVAADELIRILQANPDASIDETAAVLQGVANRYRTIVAASAVRALENSRDVYEKWGLVSPIMAGTAGFDQARAAASWAVWNAQEKRHESSPQHLDKLIGSLTRFVRNGSRETIQGSTRIAGTRWARVPGGKACSWCLMLVSRGAVYHTRKTAGGTKDWHDHCDCMVVESYTDADLPQIVHDLHEEWQDQVGISNHPNLSSDDQQAAWKAYIRQTRPLGNSVREIEADGTAIIYPGQSEVLTNTEVIIGHMGMNPKKPWQGAHEATAARRLVEMLRAGKTKMLAPKTFVDSDDSLWYCHSDIIQTVLGNPDRVTRTRRGYTYTKVVDGPDGLVRLAAEVNPVGKRDGTDLKAKVTTIYPQSGANVKEISPTGSISDVPLKGAE